VQPAFVLLNGSDLSLVMEHVGGVVPALELTEDVFDVLQINKQDQVSGVGSHLATERIRW
jgi:hypothetical protein